MKKIYYKCSFTQKAPLRISNGDGENTDSDLMRDSRGLPFIPGTSIAGVLRSMLCEQDANALFGEITDENITESHVLVSDAVLPMECTLKQVTIMQRDGVGINDLGTAVYGSKYDFEAAQTDQAYTAVLEWTGEDTDISLPVLETLMELVAAQGISFGARTSRGYGHMDASVWKKTFSFPNDLERWLAFDPMETNTFLESDIVSGSSGELNGIRILVGLHMKGSFSVRKYTTRMKKSDEENAPDYSPLQGKSGPVIPGTSWAGSFRHHMRDMAMVLGCDKEKLKQIDTIFGKMPSAEDSKKSLISFYETTITGGHNVTVTRNAVERFTQSPRSGALFTSDIHYGGIGTLEIRISEKMNDMLFLQLLAAALCDLNLGLLTVGGEAGIGRGIAEVTDIKVNEKNVKEALQRGRTDFLMRKVEKA